MPDYGEINPDDVDSAENAVRRPYLGIMFECCGVYTRIYRRPEEKAYSGRCPRCGRGVNVAVGPGGSTARIFRARPT